MPNNVLTTKTTNQIVAPVTISNAGAFTIRVQNGAAGTPSNGVPLTVRSVASPAPVISDISPTTTTIGSFSLTIDGSGFNTSTAQVVVTGPGCTTATACVVPDNVLTTRTASQIVAPVTISNAGSFTIQVQTGSVGALSNGTGLTINAAAGAPAITTVSPSSPTSSSSDQTVTVSGSGFRSGLTVTAFFPNNGGSSTLSGSR